MTSTASTKLLKPSKIARRMLSKEASPEVLKTALKMAVETASNMARHLVLSLALTKSRKTALKMAEVAATKMAHCLVATSTSTGLVLSKIIYGIEKAQLTDLLLLSSRLGPNRWQLDCTLLIINASVKLLSKSSM